MLDPRSNPAPPRPNARWCPGCDAPTLPTPRGCAWCDTPLLELGAPIARVVTHGAIELPALFAARVLPLR